MQPAFEVLGSIVLPRGLSLHSSVCTAWKKGTSLRSYSPEGTFEHAASSIQHRLVVLLLLLFV